VSSHPKMFDDLEVFLRDCAVFAHERHGLQAGRSFERAVEALLGERAVGT
jgi:hypothetical protein